MMKMDQGMVKHRYVAEFEINASVKMLYNYLSTPSGLSQWFADNVTYNPDKTFNFIWDNQDHNARIVNQKLNKMVKFEFTKNESNLHTEADPNFIEFHLDNNDLTQTTFIKIVDYSENADTKDLDELWQSLIHALKETIGAA